MTDRRATYTHGHHESVLRSHRWRTVDNSAAYLIPYLTPGKSLLDVGSGPGTITADFAARLAPGRVTALEATKEALELTRAEIDANGLTNVDYTIGDIHALELPDTSFSIVHALQVPEKSFDIVHAHQVLQHVGDPVQALREMGRVCAPGGVVAARDADYAAFSWYPELPELDEWLELYEYIARANGGEPDAGRRLHVWARQAGFTDVTATASTWCYTSDDDRAWWGGMWADRILQSALSHQLIKEGLATQDDLERISAAWHAWALDPDGWFVIVHGEILCQL